MKNLFLTAIILTIFFNYSYSQEKTSPNVIVIMTDGVRWQDIYLGLDTSISNNSRNIKNSKGIIKDFYDDNFKESRKKLMPFFWNKLEKIGELHGNRILGSKIDVSNPYWFSYPGYSELLTGKVDTLINSNDYIANPNINFFEYLNSQNQYSKRVVAFGAWNAFDRILNETRSKIPVINGFDNYSNYSKSPNAQLLTQMSQNSFKVFGDSEIQDVFIHYQAMDYLKYYQPKALFISYGETDEFAHSGSYQNYIYALNRFDSYVEEIWDFVQSSPEYKDNTIILITTDHGRGDLDKNKWTSHGKSVLDSHQTWYVIFGKDITGIGEINFDEQLYNEDLIHILAQKIGLDF